MFSINFNSKILINTYISSKFSKFFAVLSYSRFLSIFYDTKRLFISCILYWTFVNNKRALFFDSLLGVSLLPKILRALPFSDTIASLSVCSGMHGSFSSAFARARLPLFYELQHDTVLPNVLGAVQASN